MQLASRVVRVQSIAVAAQNLSRRPSRAFDTRRAYAVTSPPQGTRPPRRAPCSRLNTCHRTACPYEGHAATPSRRAIARHRFRDRCLRPASPGCSERRRHCLAAASPGFRPFLLAALSQTGALEAPRGPRGAPGITPAAPVLPELAIRFIRTVTSPGGHASGLSSYVRPPGRHSFREGWGHPSTRDFSG